jgi:hypothetical protein
VNPAELARRGHRRSPRSWRSPPEPSCRSRPGLVATGPKGAPISFVLGLGAAAAIGGVLGWQTRRHVLRSAMRQVFVVSLASGLTFLVGWLLETAAS